jgi:hypothetical protein
MSVLNEDIPAGRRSYAFFLGNDPADDLIFGVRMVLWLRSPKPADLLLQKVDMELFFVHQALEGAL